MKASKPPRTRTPATGGGRRRVAKPTKELPLPGVDAFFTRERANVGHKIPLHTASGDLTAHWIRVRGVDSDEFSRAQIQQKRRTAELAELKGTDRDDGLLDMKLELQTAMVAEWSFDMPCTHDNIKDFLRNAPQIGDEIDKFASRRSLFFKMPLNGFMPLPDGSSD